MKIFRITAFSVGITILNQRITLTDDIEFVTEFPCLLGHPVLSNAKVYFITVFPTNPRHTKKNTTRIKGLLGVWLPL